MARLIIVCGLPGSGKTTLSRDLASTRGGFRLSPDEWMDALGVNLWRSDVRARVEALQWDVDVPIDELWRRVRDRDMEAPPMERAALDLAAAAFQPPDAEELSLYDPAPAPGSSSEADRGAQPSPSPG